MPFYEYECKRCGIHFERFQHMSDAPVQTCPECGGEVHRVIQPVGVVFRGSGFYVTDNRRSSVGASGSNHKGSNGAADKGKDKETAAKTTKSESEKPVSADAAE